MSQFFVDGQSVTMGVPALGTTPQSAQPELLAQWNGEAQQVSIALSVQGATDNVLSLATDPLFPAPHYCGYVGQYAPNTAALRMESWIAGYFRITYGRGSANRVRIVDLQSAQLYLGVVTSVRIEAVRWRTVDYSAISQPSLLVGASIGPALGGEYDELVCTKSFRTLAAAGIANTAYVPRGAREWTAWVQPEDANIQYWGNAACPDVFFQNAEQLVIRPVNYAVVPPYRRMNVSNSIGAPFTVSAYSNGLAAGINCWTYIRFFLSI